MKEIKLKVLEVREYVEIDVESSYMSNSVHTKKNHVIAIIGNNLDTGRRERYSHNLTGDIGRVIAGDEISITKDKFNEREWIVTIER